MPGLDIIVQSSVTRSDVFPSATGFGTPMFLAQHTFWLDLLKSFTTLAELTTAGVPSYHPIYRMAQVAFGQSPRVKSFVVGRRTSYTPLVALTIVDATPGKVYSFSVTDQAGLTTNIAYTVLAAATTSTVATAIAALIDPLVGVTAASAAAVITVTGASGQYFSIGGLPLLSMMTVTDVTAGTSAADLAADLAAIAVYEVAVGSAVSWFGFSIDRGSEAEVKAAALWTEASKKIFAARSSDSGIASSSSTDLASDLVALAYKRTVCLYDQADLAGFIDAAALGLMLAKQPGSATWTFKTLAGVAVSRVNSAEENFVLAKNWSSYTRVAALNILYEGKTPSGGFIDATISISFTEARLQEAIYGLLYSLDVVPYTQQGIDMVVASAHKILDDATSPKRPNPIFNPKPRALVEAILESGVTIADKATRRLTGVRWSGKLAGAIHGVTVAGTVTV